MKNDKNQVGSKPSKAVASHEKPSEDKAKFVGPGQPPEVSIQLAETKKATRPVNKKVFQKSNTVDAPQDLLKPPIVQNESHSKLSSKNGGGILKKRFESQGSHDIDSISQMSKQVKILEDRNKLVNVTTAKKTGKEINNWRKNKDRMQLYHLQKALNIEDIRLQHIKELTAWSQDDKKGTNKTLYLKQVTMRNDLILNVVQQSRLEKLENYEDRWPLLSFRKSLQKIRILINMAAYRFVKHKIFENFCICIIIANSITLAKEDPLQIGSPTQAQNTMEYTFQCLYSFEMVSKIIAYGFLFNEGAYLRDPWNILDFTIVMFGFVSIIQDQISKLQNGGVESMETYDGNGAKKGLSLQSLRAFRVLRPLKAITSIKGLQILVLSVLKSLPLLQDSLLVLLAFFLVFAIACLQLMSGVLKNTCTNVTTATLLINDNGGSDPDGYSMWLCGGKQTCGDTDKYFCGKGNSNPNSGVNNFDNIMWSFLNIYQVVSGEGWSDTSVFFQKSYNEYSFLIFFGIVFIGQYFLLNLLLAVITASFSETHEIEQHKLALAREKAKKFKKKMPGQDVVIDETEPVQEIGVTEFWISKRVAFRMISQFRRNQARQAAEEIERRSRPPAEEDDEPKAIVVQMPEPYEPPEPEAKLNVRESSEEDNDFDMQIQKLVQETHDDGVENSTARKLVTKEIQLYALNDLRTANTKQRRINAEDQKKTIQTGEREKLAVTQERIPLRPQGQENLDKILDISAIIGSYGNIIEDKGNQESERSYELSYVHSQIADYPDFSEDEQPQARKRPNNSENGDSAIASDSSFEQELKPKELEEESEQQLSQNTNNKDKRTIKRSKTTEFTQTKKKKDHMGETGQSTAFNVSGTTVKHNDIDHESAFKEDSKVPKKKSRKGKKHSKKKSLANITVQDPNDKFQLFKTLVRVDDNEFVDAERSKDPYEHLNKKTQKIDINPGWPYRSTSMEEVFEIRNVLSEAIEAQESNKFVKAKMPDFVKIDEEMEDLLQEYIKPQHDPYQLKTCYKIIQQDEVEFEDDDDDALILALQPYDTVMSVGYGHLLTHRPVKFVARRSDIIVSSTLSITLSPADSEYRPLDKAELTPEQITIWCERRHQFRGMNTATHTLDIDVNEKIRIRSTQVGMRANQKDKTRAEMRQRQQSKSDLQRRETSRTISKDDANVAVKFAKKQTIIPPTLLTEPLAPEKMNGLNDEDKRDYYIQKGKYDTYMRILAKKEQQNEHPAQKRFNLGDVENLMEGKHHEQDDDDENAELAQLNTQNYIGRDENFASQKLLDFEREARRLLRSQVKHKKPKYNGLDFMPAGIKAELDINKDLGENSINFEEVIKADCSVKRKTPEWSGQDVLEIGLTNELSRWVVQKINKVRVWPKGFIGYLKKARVFLKMIVKQSLFNNLMTLFVLLNTIVMAMFKWDLDPQLVIFTNQASLIFTYIFIGEMGAKLIAIGPKKYLADKMNWLDGSVVSISIIEMIATAVSGSGGNLNAFRAIRVLRTLRVLRVARLLRQLKSIQQIIKVVSASASAFVYITTLLAVFVFIYTLLGMQLFGSGQIITPQFPQVQDYGNYTSFLVALFSVFDVMTTENWNNVLFQNMPQFYQASQATYSYVIVSIYLISWMFIGTFVLLNLFLAIIVDAFLSQDVKEEDDDEEVQRLAKIEKKRKIELEKSRRLKKMGVTLVSTSQSMLEWQENKIASQKNNSDEIDDVDDLEEPVIREIFLDEGIIQEKDEAREKRLEYQGVECQKSFYFLDKQNPFRKFFYKIFKNKRFDQVILILIILSSVKISLDSYLYLYEDDSFQAVLSEKIDICLNTAFFVECFIKNIALGFAMDKGSYLQDSWNQLDFFIVSTSLMDMVLTNIRLPIIKILRLLRTLRPLRMISKNAGMRLMITCLFESLSALANVSVVLLSGWFVFAIFGINLYSGKMSYCDIGSLQFTSKVDCNMNGGQWIIFKQNFDTIISAMQTLFNVAVIESWPDTMQATFNQPDNPGSGPVYHNSVYNGFFFVLFIMIGSYFFLNLFIGVLFLKYDQAAEREKKGFTNEHVTWIAIQKMILDQKCDHSIMNKPDWRTNPRRFKVWSIVTGSRFEIIILSVIILNIVQMAMCYEDMPLWYSNALDNSNYFFTGVFVIEMCMKQYAFQWRYFQTTWNKFDFFIVMASLLDIIISFTPTQGNPALQILPQIARLMRVLRVTRIIKLAKNMPGLQALMSTITLSVEPFTNVFILHMLALFIFSSLGNFFFKDVTHGTGFNGIFSNYRNFENFGNAFMALFIWQTGESWNYASYDTLVTAPQCTQGVNCGSSYSMLYWVPFVVVIQQIMLNLFALVVITEFETYYMDKNSPIVVYKKNLAIFMKTWIQFTVQRYRCIKLREKQLVQFFKALPMPFGLPSETTDDQTKKIMLKMGIRCDDGYVYFNELLYRCMRRQFGNFSLNRKMQILELKTQYSIFKITLSQQNVDSNMKLHEQFFDKQIGSGKSVNPFLLQMYYHISFNTWLNYSRKMQRRERFYLKQEKKRAKCIQEGKSFQPQEWEDEQVKLIEVTIELDVSVVYSSEEEEKEIQEEKDEFIQQQVNRSNKSTRIRQRSFGGSLNSIQPFNRQGAGLQ